MQERERSCIDCGVKNCDKMDKTYLDESLADNLAFALGIGHSGEFGEELGRSIDSDYIESKTFVIVEHIGKLILAMIAPELNAAWIPKRSIR